MSQGVWCSPGIIVQVYIGPSSGHSRVSLSLYRHAVPTDGRTDTTSHRDAAAHLEMKQGQIEKKKENSVNRYALRLNPCHPS